MRGQEAIVAARQAGSKPEWIDLLTQPYPQGAPAWSIPAQWVFIEPTDSVRSLDMRFVVGCLVMVDGDDSSRVRAVVDVAQKAGASRVIGSIGKPKGESVEVVEIIDTEGVMTWHN